MVMRRSCRFEQNRAWKRSNTLCAVNSRVKHIPVILPEDSPSSTPSAATSPTAAVAASAAALTAAERCTRVVQRCRRWSFSGEGWDMFRWWVHGCARCGMEVHRTLLMILALQLRQGRVPTETHFTGKKRDTAPPLRKDRQETTHPTNTVERLYT